MKELSNEQGSSISRPPYRPDLVMGGRDSIGAEVAALGIRPSSPLFDATVSVIVALEGDHLVAWCGNGGSASQASHFSAELMGRFRLNRPPLRSVSLAACPVVLTSIANDYGYDWVFARQVQGLMRQGDVLIGLTTSGTSRSVVNAMKVGGAIGVTRIVFTGDVDPTTVAGMGFPDVVVPVPGNSSIAHIQEEHTKMCHTLCAVVEDVLFRPKNEGETK